MSNHGENLLSRYLERVSDWLLFNVKLVNVRDAGPIKNAFKILMFPDAKMYQADGTKAKVCLCLNFFTYLPESQI
jgi:hypothetical protein